MTSINPYNGSRRKLVLAFDVGTTYSGISYCVLDPGQIPETKGVTKFPGQEAFDASSKVPSVIYYDQEGKIRAIGVETTNAGIIEQAEDNHWVKVEWFKLHLSAGSSFTGSSGGGNLGIPSIPPLPPKKTAVGVFADFLRYLLRCARSYIEESEPNGPGLWKALKPNINFIFSHPNGWSGVQQTAMRKAAIMARLVSSDTVAQSRVTFITEGEASLHFALKYGLPSQAIKADNGVVVVDAGGGTIDISAYSRTPNSRKQTFEEIASPQCHFKGSIVVSLHADLFLRKFLEESPYIDDVDHIVQCFDKTTKLRFKSDADPQYIKFGSTRDNDEVCKIRYGQLKLEGSDVASLFAPSIECIIQAVRYQHETGHKEFDYVVLVGGFAANDWLYKRISQALTPLGYIVYRPAYHVNKAVADGAISHYLNRLVRSRVAKVTYGVFGSIRYDNTNPEHISRREQHSYIGISGHCYISLFFVLVPKNEQIDEENELRLPLGHDIATLKDLRSTMSAVGRLSW